MKRNHKVERSILWHRLSRVSKWIPTVFASVLFISLALSQVPRVQTGLINELSDLISKNTSFRLKVGHANLTWYDEMVLRDIRLYQKSNDSTMIFAKEVKIDFSLIDYIINRNISGDKLTLNNPYVHIIKESDSTYININLFVTELKQLFKKSPKKKTSIVIDRVNINNGTFTYNDLSKSTNTRGKDFHHFSFDSLSSDIENFSFKNDSIGMKINELHAQDPANQFPIHNMKSLFAFTPNRMDFNELELRIGKSSLSDRLTFLYESSDQLKYFQDSVAFDFHLSKSHISKADLILITSKASVIETDLEISGNIAGMVNRLNTKNLDLSFGLGSEIKGSGAFNGLPNLHETFMEFSFKDTKVLTSDLKPYTNDKVYDKLSKLGNVQLNGSFIGFGTDFTSRGFMETDIGKLNCDINLKIDENKKAEYNGYVYLEDFRANQLFDELRQLESITMAGQIRGQGLDVAKANIYIDANVDSLKYKGIPLTNIYTRGHFQREFLDAQFTISDPRLRFNGTAELDLRQQQNKFRILADVDTLNLHALGISKVPLSLSSHVDINMKGLRADEIRGFINLNRTAVTHNKRSLYVDSVRFLSSLVGTQRIIQLETDGLFCEVNGEYQNSQLYNGMKKLLSELWLNIQNERDTIDSYYAAHQDRELDPFEANLTIKARNLNRFVQPFMPEFSVSKNLSISSKIKQDSIIDFYLYTKIDSIQLDKKLFVNNSVDVNFSKSYFDREVLSSVYIKSESQQWNNNLHTESFHTEFVWQKDHMDIWTRITQKNLENTFEVNSTVDFKKDETHIKMRPSKMEIFGNRWRWDKNNVAIIEGSEVKFSDFKLANDTESLEISGLYSLENRQSVNVRISDFDLRNTRPLLPFDLEGTLNGNVQIKRLKGPDKIDMGLRARGVTMYDHLVGNIFIESKWDDSHSRISSSLDIVKNEEEKLRMTGYYDISNESSPLNYTLDLMNADVKLLTPALKNILSNLDGTLEGKTKIRGTIQKPQIEGDFYVSNGKFKINYLNTSYDMNGPLYFNNRNLEFQNFELRDLEGHSALLNGTLEYLGDKLFGFNLKGAFNNFKLLNTSATDNDLYYGIAYGTGEVNFTGTSDNLQIKSNATTSKGTRLSFPISSISDVGGEQKEYIQFVDLSKKGQQEEEDVPEPERKIKGILLDLDIEMTPEAYVELIFDMKAGDIIRGRGNGNLDFFINTEGDFSMRGDYIIDKGGYNFTLYNIINKEFEIQKGSSISWFGDPYGAKLNINAQYKQLASLSPILADLSEEDQNSLEVRKKYPTIVALNLSDDLLTPTIKFDIDIQDYPTTINLTSGQPYRLEDQVNAFKNKVKFNEQEMNRQVFSLVILRKFSPESGFQVNQVDSETLGSSLSEFVSNQLSYWATQVDENLEIDVDLTSLDQDAFNTFQLRLSYTFMDGRLKVTRGGGLPSDQNKDDIYAIIGDWTVEYLLTEDGRFRAKIYSRSDLNTIQVEQGQTNIETGFSLQFVRSFDDLSQILSDSRNKNMKKASSSSTN